MSKRGMTERQDPWRVPVVVAQIPETGLHREFEADQATRDAIADVGALRAVLSVQAAFDVTPKRGGRFQVVGHVRARVGQTCVVTLDPIETDIDEPIDLMFAPAEQIPALSDLVDDGATDGNDIDPPEPIEGDVIDLGRLATDALLLGIDPYPRKPDAVFDHETTPPDPKDHPFAALKALKAKPQAKRKPKSK